MSINGYVEALMNNIKGGTQQPIFRELIGALDEAYGACMRLRLDTGPLIFGRFLLICRKSMMSAATLIASRQPEDSVGVTRRAIECARFALAIKLNDENALQWVAFQERHDRWVKRQQNEKPKAFQVQLKDVHGNEHIESLDKFLGILSDASVHFTPEFYDSLDWDERKTEGGGEIFLNYFHRNQRDVAQHFNLLAAVHGRILQVFDQCFDYEFREDVNVLAAINRFWAVAKRYSDDYAQRCGDRPPPM